MQITSFIVHFISFLLRENQENHNVPNKAETRVWRTRHLPHVKKFEKVQI